MSYIEKTLGSNERILYRVNYHWLWTAIAVLSLIFLGTFIIGIFIFLYMMIKKWTTERCITNYRLIQKTGWIARNTQEIRIDRMEEINLKQTIIDRIFDSGNIIVTGVGEGELELKFIDEPLIFQKKLNNLKQTFTKEGGGKT
tara:strand:+ start:416 stop:844 length:429 start_codon:yes stop_codon:yes gene_type:complete